MNKFIKFVKNNLAAVVGIAAIVITCLLMLLPGQFANFRTAAVDFNKVNGYEFLTNTMVRNGNTYHISSTVTFGSTLKDEFHMLPAFIALIIIFVLTIASLVLYKKSSSLLLLGGVLNVVSSVFFFAMESNAIKFYNYAGNRGADVYRGEHYEGAVLWVSYVCGALLLLAGAYAIYKSIMIMKEEVKRPDQVKGPSYNYLKK